MTEPTLRRSRMMRALWISYMLQIVGLVAGLGAGVVLALWRNGTLRVLHQLGWRALATLDKFDWFFALAIGGVCAIVMLWVWAELMRRTRYLTEEELEEIRTKWHPG